jgi:hypothetical protein
LSGSPRRRRERSGFRRRRCSQRTSPGQATCYHHARQAGQALIAATAAESGMPVATCSSRRQHEHGAFGQRPGPLPGMPLGLAAAGNSRCEGTSCRVRSPRRGPRDWPGSRCPAGAPWRSPGVGRPGGGSWEVAGISHGRACLRPPELTGAIGDKQRGERPGAQPRDAQRHVPGRSGQQPGPVPVARRRSCLGALVWGRRRPRA